MEDYISVLKYKIQKAREDSIRAEERKTALEIALNEFESLKTQKEYEEYKQFLDDNPDYVKPNNCTLACKYSDFCEYNPFCRRFERWND